MTMLEKAARAWIESYYPGTTWEQSGGIHQRSLDAMRAAMAALRESTDAMIAEGLKSEGEGAWAGPDRCWQLMIDAIIAEKP